MKTPTPPAKAIRCTQAELDLLERYRRELIDLAPTMTLWQKAAMADLLRSALLAAIAVAHNNIALPSFKEDPCNNSPSTVPQLPLFDAPLPKLADSNTQSHDAIRGHSSAPSPKPKRNVRGPAKATAQTAMNPQSPRQRKRASATTHGKKSAKK
jgi:hypothetical protein